MDDQFSKVIDMLKCNQSTEVVLKLIDGIHQKEDLYEQSIQQTKLICEIVKHNCIDILQALLDRGWSVGEIHGTDFQPLHTACAEEKIEFVRLLLKHGANATDDGRALGSEDHGSPLHFALANDNIELMKLLLPHCNDMYFLRPLHVACMQGAVKAATFLLECGHSVIDRVPRTCTRMGMSDLMPLEIAVHTSVSITELLLKHKAPTYNSEIDYRPVIFHLIGGPQFTYPMNIKPEQIPEVVKLLIKAGVDVTHTFQDEYLMQTLFKHVGQIWPFLFTMHGSIIPTLADVESVWHGLTEAAKVIKQAGLTLNANEVLSAFTKNLTDLCLSAFQQVELNGIGNDLEKYLSLSLSKGTDLFFVFWPEAGEDKEESCSTLDAILDISTELMEKLDRYMSHKKYPLFCATLCNVFARMFLNVPSKEISATPLQDFINALMPGNRDEAMTLLPLLINITPLSTVTLLTGFPDQLFSERLSLRCLSKHAILNLLPFPKEKYIRHLQIPAEMKRCLLLR